MFSAQIFYLYKLSTTNLWPLNVNDFNGGYLYSTTNTDKVLLIATEDKVSFDQTGVS